MSKRCNASRALLDESNVVTLQRANFLFHVAFNRLLYHIVEFQGPTQDWQQRRWNRTSCFGRSGQSCISPLARGCFEINRLAEA